MRTKKLDDDSHVRRLISFTCFAVTSFPQLSKKSKQPWDFEIVRNAFSKWVTDKNRDIIKISEEIEHIEPGNDEFVWYKVDKNRFAGIMILFSIIGFYRSRKGKKDKHADLLIELMKNISEGSFPGQNIIDEINLTYYWNREKMVYLAKVLELKDMTEEKFKNLPELEKWLNSSGG